MAIPENTNLKVEDLALASVSLPQAVVKGEPAPDQNSPEVENRNHNYISNEIPWYVHAMWVLFWIFAIAYVLIYQFPAIREEILSPP